MATLREAGYRFMVNQTGREANWIHPADIAQRAPGWHDCTAMTDDEFDLFMAELRAKYPPLAA